MVFSSTSALHSYHVQHAQQVQVMNQVCRCTHLPHADFISIGFESPAGQTYSSAADLGKVMALIFSSDEPQEGQVCISNPI